MVTFFTFLIFLRLEDASKDDKVKITHLVNANREKSHD